MTTRAMTLRALAVVLVAAVALTATPAPAVTPAETKYAKKIFNITNNIRENNDRVKLKRNQCLQRFANRQAQKMADQKRLFHQSLTKIQNRCGVGFVGENVARGNITPRQMVKLWMQSKPHRKNILLRQYRITGVAARKAGGQWWVAQVFGRKG
jgi:uncharacterized protein YkwD